MEFRAAERDVLLVQLEGHSFNLKDCAKWMTSPSCSRNLTCFSLPPHDLLELRFFYRCAGHGVLTGDVPANDGFLCDKAAMLGNTIKGAYSTALETYDCLRFP